MAPQAPLGNASDPEMAPDPILQDDDKSPGVRRMEAVASVFTKFDKALLFGGLFLGACKCPLLCLSSILYSLANV